MGRYPAESLSVVVSQKIIAPINEQIGNEFSAMLQYYAIAAHFSAEALSELAAHFHSQAEEEKQHALRCIEFLTDAGARVNSFSVPARGTSSAWKNIWHVRRAVEPLRARKNELCTPGCQ